MSTLSYLQRPKEKHMDLSQRQNWPFQEDPREETREVVSSSKNTLFKAVYGSKLQTVGLKWWIYLASDTGGVYKNCCWQFFWDTYSNWNFKSTSCLVLRSQDANDRYQREIPLQRPGCSAPPEVSQLSPSVSQLVWWTIALSPEDYWTMNRGETRLAMDRSVTWGKVVRNKRWTHKKRKEWTRLSGWKGLVMNKRGKQGPRIIWLWISK